ncbi:MAG: STAS domain-containing protein [Chitinispirillaceae bacterium]|jgi:anti-anti-sigma factor|nr:STAS domain-containing protein [Chitinispirillaceae bacterium]
MESQIELICEEINGRGDAQMIHFIGDLDATNVETVLEKIVGLFNAGKVHLVSDFKKLRYVNSTGLGILLHLSKSAREKSGSFKMANVNENVFEIIEIIGATSLLEIYDSVEEAVASLK